MPTAEAQLILSCKATGQKVIDDFNKSMKKLDQQAEKTLENLANVEKQLERMKSAGGNIAASGIGGNSTGRIGQRAHGLEEIKAKAKQIEDYITKTHGGIGKSINSVDTQCKNLAKSATVATGATKKLSGAFISGKIAGRLFGIEVSETSKELTQMAIIAKGIESAGKIARFVAEKTFIEPFETIINELKGNFEDAARIAGIDTAKDQRFLSYFQTLRRINDQEKISAVNRVKMQSIIDQITKSFKDYNFIIDETTGKIKNLTDLEVKFTEDSRQRAIKNTSRRILYLQEQQGELQEFINGQREIDQWVKKWMKQYSFGGNQKSAGGKVASIIGSAVSAALPGAGLIFSPSDEKSIDRRYEMLQNIITGGGYSKSVLDASRTLSTVQDQLLSTKNILNDLLSQDPTKFLRALDLAKKADELERLNTAFSKMLEGLKREENLTRLMIAGRGEEAKRLRALYTLQSKIPGLSEEQYKKLTDQILLNGKLEESHRKSIADQERMNRAQEQYNAFLTDLYKTAGEFRATATGAISANSAEAAILQSRQILQLTPVQEYKEIALQRRQQLTPYQMPKEQPATKTAPVTPGVSELKTVVLDLKKIVSLLTTGNQNSNDIKSRFEQLSFSTYKQ